MDIRTETQLLILVAYCAELQAFSIQVDARQGRLLEQSMQFHVFICASLRISTNKRKNSTLLLLVRCSLKIVTVHYIPVHEKTLKS